MARLEVKPRSWFKLNPNQPRKLPAHDDDLSLEQRADLIRLGKSLRKKQLQPLLCLPDGTILGGERRFRAAGIEGLETLEVKIVDEVLSDSDKKSGESSTTC